MCVPMSSEVEVYHVGPFLHEPLISMPCNTPFGTEYDTTGGRAQGKQQNDRYDDGIFNMATTHYADL